MRVECDVYSGRPNPHWELSAEQAEEFLQKLRALPHGERDAALLDGLGYRGLIVTGDELKPAGDDEITISNGLVVGRQGSVSRPLRDEERALERWLLETGKGKLEADLYEYLSSEVGRN